MGSIQQKLKYHSTLAVNSTLCRLGLRARLTRNRPGGRMLVYHGIDHTGSTRFNTRFISARQFEQHLAYFSRHFHVVSLADYCAGVRDPNRLTVCLTFDDGYRNNLELALPLLEKYQVPAAFYLTGIIETEVPVLWADLLDLVTALQDAPLQLEGEEFRKNRKGEYASTSRSLTLKQVCKRTGNAFKATMVEALLARHSLQDLADLGVYWQQLNRDEIRELARSPMATIGSHGYYHNNFEAIPLPEVRQELEQSRDFLSGLTQQPVTTLAYPDGSYTREVVETAAAAGYEWQLAVDHRYPEDREDPRVVERFGVNPFINWDNQLIALLKGRYT